MIELKLEKKQKKMVCGCAKQQWHMPKKEPQKE
jgi:hypothetical protein